jgi:hypothetical protein
LLYDSGESGRFVAKTKVRKFIADRFSGRRSGKAQSTTGRGEDDEEGASTAMNARRFAVSIVLAVLAVLTLTTTAGAEPAWVLWVEAPASSDQWSIAAIPQSRFKTKEECERRAHDLNESEQLVARMERMTGDSRDVFSCLPDTVDPRPEGALR